MIYSHVRYGAPFDSRKLHNFVFGKSHGFGFSEKLRCQPLRLEVFLHICYVLYFIQEPRVNSRYLKQLLYCKYISSVNLRNGKESFVISSFELCNQFFIIKSVYIWISESVTLDLKRCNRLEKRALKGPAYCHNLACSLHLRA